MSNEKESANVAAVQVAENVEVNKPTENNKTTENKSSEIYELPKFSIQQMLECGVHFGHKTMRRNPKMQKYIFKDHNGLSIIDLNKTAYLLRNAMATAKEVAKNNGRILFVGTKKQACDIISDYAKRCGQYYVNFRWLGGMLTNWRTVSQSIKTLKKLEEDLSDEEMGYNKKEKLVMTRKIGKLDNSLGGIRTMDGCPDLIFVIDTLHESLAIAEARKLGIPIMALVDSNSNPDVVDHPIPGNDDSSKSIRFFCRLISEAAAQGLEEGMIVAGLDVSKIKNEEEDTVDFHSLRKEMNEEKREAAKRKSNGGSRTPRKPDQRSSNDFARGGKPRSNRPSNDRKPTTNSSAEAPKARVEGVENKSE